MRRSWVCKDNNDEINVFMTPTDSHLEVLLLSEVQTVGGVKGYKRDFSSKDSY